MIQVNTVTTRLNHWMSQQRKIYWPNVILESKRNQKAEERENKKSKKMFYATLHSCMHT